MKKTKKRNKYTKPIISVCSLALIVVVLLSNSVVAFADGGQIGNSKRDLGDIDLYTKPQADHGLPFDVIYYGMIYNTFGGSTVGLLSNNYTLNEFGVTYPPSHTGSSAYTGDQYARIENIPSPSLQVPYPNYNRAFVYSYYDYLGISEPTRWFDDPVSYRYTSYLFGRRIAEGYYSAGSAFDEVLEHAESYTTGDLITDNSYVAASVEQKYHGALSMDLITQQNVDDDYLYFPSFFTNYVLVPLMAEGKRPYFDISVKGYDLSGGGLDVVDLRYVSTNPDLNLDDYFHFFYVEPNASELNLFGVSAIYDTLYGLTTERLVFSVGDFFSNVVSDSDIDIVTDISIRFGAEYYTTNSVITNYYNVSSSYPIVGSSVDYYSITPYTEQRHFDEVLTALRASSGGSYPNGVVAWLGDTVSGIMDVDLFGTFGLGDLMFTTIGLGVFIAFLKIFVGG